MQINLNFHKDSKHLGTVETNTVALDDIIPQIGDNVEYKDKFQSYHGKVKNREFYIDHETYERVLYIHINC